MTVCQNVVEIEGLEPSLTEPESVVLPLHHISIWLPFLNFGTAKVLMFCENAKYFYKKMMGGNDCRQKDALNAGT